MRSRFCDSALSCYISDEAVIRLRRRLLHSVELNEAGKDLLGLGAEDYSAVASVPDTVISKTASWQDLAPGNTETGSIGVRDAAE